VEDPVEQVIPGIMQTEVNDARGLTFGCAARHLLRQDPQTLVLGEIRDDETATLAVRAALTGHQVITTLHAGSCKGVLERLLVMCPDRYAVVSAVEFILNQRLLRQTCQACGGAGCAACLRTGYHGRVLTAEWLKIGEPTRRRLRADGPDALQPARPLAEAARDLVKQGRTNEAEYQRVFGP
jgi:type II secretory ATPase GspE/PulE/Tfp pilus assembly ATPase PilB-like protein